MKREKENNSGSGETAPLILARAGLENPVAIATAWALTIPNWQEIAQGDLQQEASGFALEVTHAVNAPKELPLQKRFSQVVGQVVGASYVARLVTTALLIEELTLDKSEPGSGLRIIESLETDKEMTKKEAAGVFYLALKGRDGEKNPLLPRLEKAIGKSGVLTPQDKEKAEIESAYINFERKVDRFRREIIQSYVPFGFTRSDSRIPSVGFMEHFEEYCSRAGERGQLARKYISLPNLYEFCGKMLRLFSKEDLAKKTSVVRLDRSERDNWLGAKEELGKLLNSQPTQNK